MKLCDNPHCVRACAHTIGGAITAVVHTSTFLKCILVIPMVDFRSIKYCVRSLVANIRRDVRVSVSEYHISRGHSNTRADTHTHTQSGQLPPMCLYRSGQTIAHSHSLCKCLHTIYVREGRTFCAKFEAFFLISMTAFASGRKHRCFRLRDPAVH